VCKLAFYLVLIQPFGWYIWEPLKRDAQCQMCFGFFLLAVLLFRKRVVLLMLVSILGCLVLSFYRIVYGPVLICAAAYAFIRGDGRVSGKIAGRVLVVVVVLLALFLLAPKQYSDSAVDYLTHLVIKYGVGDAAAVAEKGYQTRLTKHSSWIASVPNRLALGLISPFPWTNILARKNSFEWSWYLTDYLHTALMFVCFAAITVFGLRDFKKRKCPPVSVVFALGIAASGFFGYAVHNVYVQVGMLCTFPYVLDKLGKKKMFNCFLISICFFVISSVLWNYIR